MKPDSLPPLIAPDWQTGPRAPQLANDQIHLWRIELDLPPEPGTACLDHSERERLRRLAPGAARRRFAAAHSAKRRVLGRYLDREPGELGFLAGSKGKPRLAGPAGFEFNLSHSAGLALLVVARGRPLGVDLERVRAVGQAIRIARRVLAEGQIDLLEGLPPDARDEGFFRAWTEFESRQKLTGAGLFGPRTGSAGVAGRLFVPAPGFVAALAWRNGDMQVQLRHFDFGRT